MPGGRGRPSVRDCIFSAATRSALALPSVKRGEDQILEHLLVGRRQERGVDAHALQFALGGERQTHHAAARLTFNLNASEFLLRFLELGLDGLRLFHHAHDIHGAVSFSNVIGRVVDAGIGVTDLIVGLAGDGSRRVRGGRRVRTPHIDDAGPFEAVKNLQHQRMRGRIACSLGLTRLRRSPAASARSSPGQAPPSSARPSIPAVDGSASAPIRARPLRPG